MQIQGNFKYDLVKHKTQGNKRRNQYSCCHIWRLIQSTICQYLDLEAKTEKSTLFSATSKVWEKKVVLLFSILASRPRYWWFVILTSLRNWLKSPVSRIPFPKRLKVNKPRSFRYTAFHKKQQLCDFFKFYYPMLGEVYPQQTWCRSLQISKLKSPNMCVSNELLKNYNIWARSKNIELSVQLCFCHKGTNMH